MSRTAWLVWLATAFAFGVVAWSPLGDRVAADILLSSLTWALVAFPIGVLASRAQKLGQRPALILGCGLAWGTAYVAGLYAAATFQSGLYAEPDILLILVLWVSPVALAIAIVAMLLSIAGLWLAKQLPWRSPREDQRYRTEPPP